MPRALDLYILADFFQDVDVIKWKFMVRYWLLAALPLAVAAQDPADLFNKPPAAVDQALRARISEFYELHVKGDFRRAEALVAEDTKDFFYNNNKPKYLSFEIAAIKYTDDFTRATATVLCEQIVPFPGFEGKPIKIPTPSTWKLENGQWVWWVDPEKLRETPFGRMTAGPGTGKAAAPIAIPTSVEQFMTQVKADKQSVTLKPGESAEVAITNSAPGLMKVSIAGAVPGVDAKLERGDIKPGDRVVLTLHAGDKAKSGSLQVVVAPTGQIIPIQITVP
jgi:hypothetical protein